jgi:hypothetical protein
MTLPEIPHLRRELSVPPDFFMAKSRSRLYLRSVLIGAEPQPHAMNSPR